MSDEPTAPVQQKVHTLTARRMEDTVVPAGGILNTVTLDRPIPSGELVRAYIPEGARKDDVLKALLTLVKYVEENWYTVTVDEIGERLAESHGNKALDKWINDTLTWLDNLSGDSEPPPPPWHE
jgi:hypothetical protein